ncbi:MAG: phosphate ABC transporter permease subunit PstC [Acidobacteria bacterium]|nr:phosphate ABC transporter permease subunit PstC [Acidobacteriota bacterium]
MGTAATTLERDFALAKRRHWIDWAVQGIIYSSAVVSLSIIALIFIFVGREALPVFTSAEVHEEVTLATMFLPQNYGTPEAPLPYVWQPVGEFPKYSLMPLFLGTLKATLVAMLFATPLAILAAIYTTEFAPAWLREAVKPVVEMLAGIPSVVLGFFALIVLATWMQDFFDFEYRLNAITAGIALGLAVLPIVYTVAEDALNAVPARFRNASYALGATPWQTAWRVTLPAALPGVFAGIVLGFGRAMGETMIVLMASGNAAITSWNFFESVRTFPATIAAELGEVVFGSAHYHVLFFVGTLLFAITFLLNFLGAKVVAQMRRSLSGADA